MRIGYKITFSWAWLFGEVNTRTGTPIALRFPGRWFQSESGLHQNWMRDYDPTTGRYIQADPLGLVDGASVYGYVGQNPANFFDFQGLKDKRNTSREGTVTNRSSRTLTLVDLDNRRRQPLPPGDTSPEGTDWDFIIDGCECIKVFTTAIVDENWILAYHRPFYDYPFTIPIPGSVMRFTGKDKCCFFD